MTQPIVHGQPHTGQPCLSAERYEANKARFLCEVLRHDESAPIPGDELGAIFGVDRRVMRDWAHRARVEGNPIGSNGKGYFHARTKEQKERQHRKLLSRMGNQGEAAAAMGRQAKSDGCGAEQVPLPLAETPAIPQYGDRMCEPELGPGRVIDYNPWTDRVQLHFDRGCYGWFYLNEVTALPRETPAQIIIEGDPSWKPTSR